MIVKKWFTILLALAFFAAPVAAYADDDDDEEEEEEEEEEEAPKKSSKKKPAKKKVPDGPSRIGFYTSFGSSSPTIGFVYDMGSGLQLGLGVGLDRLSTTRPGEDPIVTQTYSVEPILTYSLGNGLLGYGLSLRAFYNSSTMGDSDPVTSMGGIPSLYASAALIPNLVVSLNAGLKVTMYGENFPVKNSLVDASVVVESGMHIQTATSVMFIFYFL